MCDLPATVDPPHVGRIVARCGSVWAITMPAVLGQAVKVWMQNQGYKLGPILSHPRSKRWTFIIRPDLPDEISLFAEMFRLDVSIAREGGTIGLPSPADVGTKFRAWIARPDSHVRPSGHVIIEAIRAVRAEKTARRRRVMTYA
ncbi:DNA-directed RNA polymerase subunit beta [Nocardia beijingensis]|uniref:DNA-directed RNA polymerase subunit beta n=1 Tax=Nocardia beijingensis TaxID=95162 RepID=UPI001FD62051|nr:DNA-directed RNA polymerase subunit beta [Nocardia beijingensis]